MYCGHKSIALTVCCSLNSTVWTYTYTHPKAINVFFFVFVFKYLFAMSEGTFFKWIEFDPFTTKFSFKVNTTWFGIPIVGKQLLLVTKVVAV